MNNITSIMVSADWHIGATDPYRFRLELLRTVESVIKEKKKLDLFVVAGDTFDMKEYLSSDSVKVFFLIMVELLNFTENDINWEECNRIATSSRVYEVCELWNSGNHVINSIATVMKLSGNTIRNYLRRGFELDILKDPPKYLLKA